MLCSWRRFLFIHNAIKEILIYESPSGSTISQDYFYDMASIIKRVLNKRIFYGEFGKKRFLCELAARSSMFVFNVVLTV